MYEYICFFLILMSLCCLVYIYKNKNTIPNVSWPFINLKDENYNNINVICIRGPFSSDKNKEKNIKLFKDYLKKGIKFIGCSSYLTYPGLCENTNGHCHYDDNKIDGYNIEDYVLGWCHCFRYPDKYIKPNTPKILISESDFNAERLKPDDKVEVLYDFVIFQPSDKDCKYGWNSFNKNWRLAEYCIQVMCDKLNMKGVLIGRGKCPVNIKNKNNLIVTEHIKYKKAMNYVRQSKFLLATNYEDASPRTLTEALALNKPIFVYEKILGGWKYVTSESGLFFNKNNFLINLRILLNNIKKGYYSPREYYINNYTIKNSGKQLRNFIKYLYPEMTDCEYVSFPIS